MKKMNKKDAELADLLYMAREGFTSDFDAVLDRLIELLIGDGLDRDQIHLFLDTLLYIEHLPN